MGWPVQKESIFIGLERSLLHWEQALLLIATPCPYSEAMTMVSALCRIWPEPASSIPFLSILLPLTSFQPHGLLPISRVHQVWSHLGAFASTIPPTLRVLSPAIHVDLCGSFPPLLLIYLEATSSRRPTLISHANIVPLSPLQPLLAPASCSLSFPLSYVLGVHHSLKSLTVYSVWVIYHPCPPPGCKCWQGAVLSCYNCALYVVFECMDVWVYPALRKLRLKAGTCPRSHSW